MSRGDIEFIQIEASEDANAVRDRLSFYRGQRVLLIWPEEGTALTRKLDLVLIQREAMRRSVRLALVTHDTGVIRNARELKISTFETIGASERGRWQRGRSKVFTNRNQRPKNEPDADELMPVASRVRFPRPQLSGIQSFLMRIAILAALFAVVASVAYVVIPGATIRIAPVQEIIEASVEIAVNTDAAFTRVDIDGAVIPGTPIILEVEDLETVNATGQVDLGNERAVGTVVFINQTNAAVEIPLGTNVSTSTGTPVVFRTTEEALLPANEGAQVEVPIEAMPAYSGGVGNVGENLINTVVGPLENNVTVLNLNPTTGGVSQVRLAVTEQDIDLALAYVRQKLQDRAYVAMVSQLSGSQFIILETLQITEERNDWTIFSAEPGDVADSVTVRMKAIVSAVAVDEQLAQQIVFADMSEQTLRGREMRTETIEYTRGPVTINGDQINFSMSGRGLVQGRVDTGQLKEQLAGRSLSSAEQYLLSRVDLAENTTPQIEISPSGFNRMPLLPMRITVILENVR